MDFIVSGHASRCFKATASRSFRAPMLSNALLWKYFSRNSSQMCSYGSSSGEYGGGKCSRRFSDVTNALLRCQPATSTTMMIFSSGYRAAISLTNNCILRQGSLQVAPFGGEYIPVPQAVAGIATCYAKNLSSFFTAVQIRCLALWLRIS